MNYNEIQAAWDSQDEQSPFTIDLDVLRAQVVSDARSYGETLTMLQAGAMLVLFFLSGRSLIVASAAAGGSHHYAGFAITFLAGCYLARKLWLRKRHEITFDDSLQGILRKSISRIDYLVSLVKSLVWCFALPLFALAGLKYYFEGSAHALIGMAALFVVLVIAVFASRHEINRRHLPQKRKCQTLLDKLQEPGPDAS